MKAPLMGVSDAISRMDNASHTHGFVGDLSGLSHSFREADPDKLLTCFTTLSSKNNSVITSLQRETGVSPGTLRSVCEVFLNLLNAQRRIVEDGKEAILPLNDKLSEVRSLLQTAIEECAALQWTTDPPADLEHLRKRRGATDSRNASDDSPSVSMEASSAKLTSADDWVDRIFFDQIDGVSNLVGSAFQIAVVYQHLRFLFKMDPEKEADWRTVRTPVLLAEDGESGGLRLVLTVSLKPSPLQAFIPDYRYFGLTELKHSSDDYCLLKSAQRCWKAAGLKGYMGVWRMEHGTIVPDNGSTGSTSVDFGQMTHFDATPVTHLYGRSFEAAFVCCLRAAAGNAYGDKLPEITSGDEYAQRVNAHALRELWQVDPLSPTTAISAMLGEYHPDQTDIKDIPLVAVGGVPQKLCEARGTEITQVVFASNQWTDESVAKLDSKSQQDYQKSLLGDQQPENRSRLQWSTAGTIGEALDTLLVRSRWLKAWQRDVRENWLKRWECRPKDADGNFVHGGARAPGDDAPGPDHMNLPRQTEQA